MRFAALLLGTLLASSLCHAASVQRTVWDALHLGRADAATSKIVAQAAQGEPDNAVQFLAVAARAVLTPTPRHTEQLRTALRDALDPHHAVALPRATPDFPVGFDRERLLTALAGALVALGEIEFALDALDHRLARSDQPDSEMLWQVVRVVGGDRAKRILNGPFRFRDGEWFPKRLAEERYFPDWEDLKRFSDLIPNAQRTLAQLEREALAGCGVKPAVAAYYLAHVPALDRGEQARIDNVLLRVAKRTQGDCFWARLLAARSLALRGTRDPALWLTLWPTDSENAYYRAAIARFAFAQHGRDFAPHALRLLEQPLNGYAEAELAFNLGSLIEARRWRDYWDIWHVRGSGFFGYSFRYRSDEIALDPGPTLAWLERRGSAVGARLQHSLLAPAGRVSGAGFQTWLKLAVSHSDPNVGWWIFQDVGEPAALPVLRYWKQSVYKHRHEAIVQYSRQIVYKIDDRYPECCAATEACLRKRVAANNARWVAAQSIGTPAELSRWVEGVPWLATMGANAQSVLMVDPATRLAEVRIAGRPSEQWQHLFGCWMPLRRE